MGSSNKPGRIKISWIKKLSSFAVPLTIGIFTLVTTLQNRHIARQERDQDMRQVEDEQREAVFVSYIDDISRFRDQNSVNLTQNPDKLIYVHSKTLAALRTLDVGRKKNLLFFLKDSLLLSSDETSLLFDADFSEIRIEGEKCKFSSLVFSGAYFNQVSLLNCLFENIIFRGISFRRSNFTRSTFINTQFISCKMEEAIFHQVILSEVNFDGSSLNQADFTEVRFDSVTMSNANLTGAMVPSLDQVRSVEMINSILPNGSFSQIEDLRVIPDQCASLDQWMILPVNSVEVRDCLLIARAANVTLEHKVKFPFAQRALLVDAGRAQFCVQFNRTWNTTANSFDVIFLGGRHGVYDAHEASESFTSRSVAFSNCSVLDCTTNIGGTCEYRARIPAFTRVAFLNIYLSRIGDAVFNLSYSIEHVDD